VKLFSRQPERTDVRVCAAVRRQRLIYGALVNKLGKLHGYCQLEGSHTLQKSGCQTNDKVEWQTGHRRQLSGHYDDCPGAQTRLQSPERRRLVRTPKRPVWNDVAVQYDLAVQSDRMGQHDVTVPYNGVTVQHVRQHRRCSSCRSNSLSAEAPTPTRKHSALLAVLRLLLRSWWLFFSLCLSSSVLAPFN